MAQAPQIITAAEMTKMLKEHNHMPQLISKEEITQLIKLINTQFARKRSGLLNLDFQGYIDFLVQMALIVYNRPPCDLSGLPAIECLKAMVRRFEQATREKGLNALLYEDIDA